MKNIEILFAEFGGKFSPDVENVRKYFPEAAVEVYGPELEDMFPDNHDAHWGNYMNDYWKVKKLLQSEADIAICMDADTRIVSENVKAIIPLVSRFGLCLPANPRKLVKIDTEIGSHSDRKLDATLGMGYAFNMTPIAFNTRDNMSRAVLTAYCEMMLKNPVRGPLAMWRAVLIGGMFPCLLPPQWCVCAEDVGIGNELILHVGHDKVREYYA
jgi:hypothetical protein